MNGAISGDNMQTAVPDNQIGPDSSVGVTADPGGQVNGQAAPTQDNIGNVDPNRLPPELRKIHDSMLRDYRSKTEKAAESVKMAEEYKRQLEALKPKAEWYDNISANDVARERINKTIEELTSEMSRQENQPGGPDNKVMQELEQIKMEMQTEKNLQYINAFAEAKDDKGNLLHPEMEKFSSIKIGTHQEAGDYDLLRASVELAAGNTPQERLENGYKAAESIYKSIFEEGRKAGMGRLQTKAKNGTLPPSSSAASSTAPRRPKNALEALQFAQRGYAPAEE